VEKYQSYKLLEIIALQAYVIEILKAQKEPAKVKFMTQEEKQEFVIGIIAEHFGVTREELCGRKRQERIMLPRHVTSFMLRKYFNLSSQAVGKIIGRDHSTVLHSGYVVENMIFTDNKFKRTIVKIEQQINSNMNFSNQEIIIE